jgi:hypothetical protein
MKTYTSMLTTGSAKAGEVMIGGIEALRFGDLTNWATHRLIRYIQEA